MKITRSIYETKEEKCAHHQQRTRVSLRKFLVSLRRERVYIFRRASYRVQSVGSFPFAAATVLTQLPFDIPADYYQLLLVLVLCD